MYGFNIQYPFLYLSFRTPIYFKAIMNLCLLHAAPTFPSLSCKKMLGSWFLNAFLISYNYRALIIIK